MSSHVYRTIDVPVSGGALRVGVWEPEGEATGSALLIHGVTSSHLAWPFVVRQLPGIRLIAPDLRGRGMSSTVHGAAGMAAHADDMAAVLDAVGIGSTTVVGHSMGAFVAVAFAHRHPDRVRDLVLVDGGFPLDLPAGVDPDQLVQVVLGPVAERLSMRWSGVQEYTDTFWRHHPALVDDWSDEVEQYIAYDLVPDGDAFRAATTYESMADDTRDMNVGTLLPEALAALSKPTLFITVPRGLQNETPGLYPPAHLADLLTAFPQVRHVHLDDLNHYTVVMSERGAAMLAPLIRAELG
ncbi:alpha/beta hydrolase [uncultured Microbacterium sp.]|jgi:pimeloyl-ACP methyl ester carboxylesterase|uniref:alpha/beta hydrolase n=1 Tax=uncultured Microbacterium sp. TaxID=191216 RepID=UPI00262F5F3F|nr:alpha/beta hydrolase [uncultured Microbacterium sp.]